MAYGSWSSARWTQIWNNGYYKAEVEWSYRQDVIANKTEYRTTKIRITSIKSGYGFWNASATAGVATITAQRKTQTVNANVTGGGSQIFDVTDDSREFTHNSDGTINTGLAWVHGYFTANVGGENYAPEFGWANTDISSQIPTIDRVVPVATSELYSKTYNSITLKLTSDSKSSLASYKINYGEWTNFSTSGTDVDKTGGGTIYKTFSGLSPNSSYTIRVQFRRDVNEVWSNMATVTTTTPKPSAPTKGSVSVTSKTYNSIACSISGFSFGAGATWGYYQWSLNGSTWNNIGSNTSFTITGLSPNTTYNIYVRLVDNYGSVSSNASTSATTPKPSAPTKGSVSVSNITPFGAILSWSGFSFGAGGTWGYYQYSLNGSDWVNNGNQTIVTLTNLNSETNYTFYVRLVDNYGTASSNATVPFTTLVDQVKARIKVSGAWKIGKLFYKKNGTWVKAKKVYEKVNGTWRINQ